MHRARNDTWIVVKNWGPPPLPPTEGRLCYFAAFLKEEGLSRATVKSYLSAVRHVQTSQGMGDPSVGDMPWLRLIVRGMRKELAGQPKKSRLPITPTIMHQIRQRWQGHDTEWDYIMLWAAMCLCFFGFLRSGEVVVPSHAAFDPSQHLTFNNVAVDSREKPSFLNVTIKQSKRLERGWTSSLGVPRVHYARWQPC